MKGDVTADVGIADHLAGSVDAVSLAPRTAERAEVIGTGLMALLAAVRKAWNAVLPLSKAVPTTWPESLIPEAVLHVPPSVPRSSVAGLMGRLAAVRKAWKGALPVVAAEPTTWPESLIPKAELPVPPSVPRSSVAGLMGLLAAVRKAWKAVLPLI